MSSPAVQEQLQSRQCRGMLSYSSRLEFEMGRLIRLAFGEDIMKCNLGCKPLDADRLVKEWLVMFVCFDKRATNCCHDC